MIERCHICGKGYNLEVYAEKHRKYVPRVCGSECFVRFLKEPKRELPKDLKRIVYRESDMSMRSDFERGVANWHIRNGIVYAYEPFNLYHKERSYLPDFYIAKTAIFLEVKGIWEAGYFDRFRIFADNYPDMFYVIDLPFMRRIKARPSKI